MNASRIRNLAWAVMSLIVVASLPANADPVTMHTAQTTAGNDVYGGFGLTFNVTEAIQVLELGIYDSGDDGISGTLSAYLFDSTTRRVLAQMAFTAADPGVGVAGDGDPYWWKTLPAPLVLDPGQYTLGGYGWDRANKAHNVVYGGPSPIFNGGGLIGFVHSGYTAGGAGTFPGAYEGTDCYDAADMRFTHAPLPSAVLLGILGLGVAGRKLCRLA